MSQSAPPAPGAFAIVCAERATGIVLNTTGAWAVPGDPRYRTFRSLDEARQEAAKLARENPEWECVVLDGGGTVLETYFEGPTA